MVLDGGVDGVAAAEEAVDEAGAEAAGGVHDADGVRGLVERSGRHPREREWRDIETTPAARRGEERRDGWKMVEKEAKDRWEGI